MERIIETERLYVREFMIKDASALFKMSQNQKVLNNTFKNIEAAELFIKNYTYSFKNNIGIWVVCGKKQGEFFGLCGLEEKSNSGVVNLLYNFSEKHWNKGLATEACNGVITYAFNVLRVEEICAQINNKNEKAINVILKLNFIKDSNKKIDNVAFYFLKNKLIMVKKISYKDTYKIRHKVLRQGKPLETCYFKGDKDETTFHLGLFYYGELIGIASFMKALSKDIKEIDQYQLRGMAILQQFQGKSFGNVLLESCIRELQQQKISVLWCNARLNAVNFYTRFNFKKIGNSFNIEKVGLHYQMYLKITQNKYNT